MSFLPPDPHARLGSTILWYTTNISTFITNGALFIICLFIPRLRRNLLLLNLLFLFVAASFVATSLIWTGHMMDQFPPYKACLFNGMFTYTNGYIGGGAALGLAIKVWANVLSVEYPKARILLWLSWEPMLLALPYLVTVPLWLVSLINGLRHPELVFRATERYCVAYQPVLDKMNPFIGIFLSGTAFILCVWTALIVSRIRAAVRSTHENPIKGYSLVVRVLIFGIFVAAGTLTNVVSLTPNFDVPTRDMFLSIAGTGAFLIFGSDKDVLAFVFRCRRNTDTDTAYRSTAVSYTKQTFVRREGPGGELVTFPANGSGAPFPSSIVLSKHVVNDLELGPVSHDMYDDTLRTLNKADSDAEGEELQWDAKQSTIMRTPSLRSKDDRFHG